MNRTERLQLALTQIANAERKINLMLGLNPESPITPQERLLIDETREELRMAKSNVRYTHKQR